MGVYLVAGSGGIEFEAGLPIAAGGPFGKTNARSALPGILPHGKGVAGDVAGSIGGELIPVTGVYGFGALGGCSGGGVFPSVSPNGGEGTWHGVLYRDGGQRRGHRQNAGQRHQDGE